MTFKKALVGAAFIVAVGVQHANAYEFGSPGASQKPGLLLGGASAEDPPPGLYMFDQFLTYQSKIVGPGAPNGGGTATRVNGAVGGTGFLWVPGWTFLGATYDAVLVQPVIMADLGSPINVQQSGAHNTYIVPIELSWKLGGSGFYVKTGLGIYAPDGSISGDNGLGNIGNPWWTFQPELALSYLKDGWNFTAFMFDEINTKSSITGYTSGDIFHAEFTAAKTIGKWTVGAVAYFAGQVTGDTSSAFYHGAINVNSYDVWAAGGLVGYNFGPVQLNVWVLDEFSAHASGGSTPIPGPDTAAITKGYTAFAQVSYRLWAPDAPATLKGPQIYK
jgi:hypothetical protein